MSSHDRGIVKDMIFSVAEGDVPKLKDSLMRFAVTRGDSSELDHSTFLSDLDFIIADFAGLDLKDLDIGEFLTSLVSLARKNDIELPSVVTLFARGMVTLEGLLTEYMPNVNMIEIISAHITHEKSSYQRLQEGVEELAGASLRAVRGQLEAAEQLGLASRMLTRGQLKINAQVLGSEQVLRRLGGLLRQDRAGHLRHTGHRLPWVHQRAHPGFGAGARDLAQQSRRQVAAAGRPSFRRAPLRPMRRRGARFRVLTAARR